MLRFYPSKTYAIGGAIAFAVTWMVMGTVFSDTLSLSFVVFMSVLGALVWIGLSLLGGWLTSRK